MNRFETREHDSPVVICGVRQEILQQHSVDEARHIEVVVWIDCHAGVVLHISSPIFRSFLGPLTAIGFYTQCVS
jgi:hypothetical protein